MNWLNGLHWLGYAVLVAGWWVTGLGVFLLSNEGLDTDELIGWLVITVVTIFLTGASL